ncbi:MAG: hypothetical protein JO299_08340 [Gammaproteobacteria bacterium]|nr:hypothetical protein [Gammaproteobacteria bacterium]
MDAPAIDPQFLSAPEDVEAMVKGFKSTRRLMDARHCARCAKRNCSPRTGASTRTSASSCGRTSIRSITPSAPARWVAQVRRGRRLEPSGTRPGASADC